MSQRKADLFRQALGRFPTGVAIITAVDPLTQTPLGLTVSSFNSVSLEPPLVLWSLQNSSSLLEVFLRLERYNIHVLNAEQATLAIAFSRGTQKERFSNIAWQKNKWGVPRLDPSRVCAYFECLPHAHYLAGDHHIMVAQVEYCEHQNNMPLIFHGGNFDLTPQKN